MIALCMALVSIPACLLIIWFLSPLFKTVMESVVTTWGATVGLSGFALALANAMPFIVPMAGFATIILGIIGLARNRSSI